MCGRYTIVTTPQQMRATYGYVEQPNFPPRYNVAPTQPVSIVTQERGERHFRLVRWGLWPAWVKDPKTFPLLINARAETLLEKSTYRGAMRYRRCVFVADGFYEWRRAAGRGKEPYLVRMQGGGPMPFAGLWETWLGADGSEVDTAAIVTTAANGTLAAIHERMPVILDAAATARWLDVGAVDAGEAAALCRPFEGELTLTRVSTRVNKVANDDEGLIAPAGTPEAETQPATEPEPQGSLPDLGPMNPR